MPSSSSRTRFNQRRSAPGELRFVSIPLRDDGWRGWLTAGLFALVAVAGALMSSSALMGALILAAFAIAARRLWLPTTYDIGPAGIAERFLGRSRRIPWSQIARYQPRPRGVLLSAVADETPLAAVYSQYVCTRQHRDALVQLVEFHLRGADSGGVSIESTVSGAGQREPTGQSSFELVRR